MKQLVEVKWRVHLMESERGWGQDFWTEDYDTEAQAKERFDSVNAKNTSPTAPDWYMQAQKIEKVFIEE